MWCADPKVRSISEIPELWMSASESVPEAPVLGSSLPATLAAGNATADSGSGGNLSELVSRAATDKAASISVHSLYKDKVSWDVNNRPYRFPWGSCLADLNCRDRFEKPFIYECDAKCSLTIGQNNKSKAGAVWSAGIQLA